MDKLKLYLLFHPMKCRGLVPIDIRACVCVCVSFCVFKLKSKRKRLSKIVFKIDDELTTAFVSANLQQSHEMNRSEAYAAEEDTQV